MNGSYKARTFVPRHIGSVGRLAVLVTAACAGQTRPPQIAPATLAAFGCAPPTTAVPYAPPVVGEPVCDTLSRLGQPVKFEVNETEFMQLIHLEWYARGRTLWANVQSRRGAWVVTGTAY